MSGLQICSAAQRTQCRCSSRACGFWDREGPCRILLPVYRDMADAIKERGVVFTPPDVARFMVSLMDPRPGQRILEPSCGEGSILEHIPSHNHITGVDLNPAFVRTCRRRFPHATILRCDFLRFTPPHGELYDCILGNPPYVKIQNLAPDVVDRMRMQYPEQIQGNTNLYAYFLLRCMDLLAPNGHLIFLIPNTLFYNKSLQPVLRRFVDGRNLRLVVDFRDEQVFDGVATYTCVVHLTKEPNPHPYYLRRVGLTGRDRRIRFAPPGSRPRQDPPPFRARIGLMTLCDSVYILPNGRPAADPRFLCFDREGRTYTIEAAACRRILKVSKRKFHYIIYPYLPAPGAPGVSIDRGFLDRYPKAAGYLREHKALLDARDRGDTSKYPMWYAYGRTQGLRPQEARRRLFLPAVVRGDLPLRAQVFRSEAPLYYAGLWLEPLPGCTQREILDWIEAHQDAILRASNVRSGGWYALGQGSFANAHSG